MANRGIFNHLMNTPSRLSAYLQSAAVLVPAVLVSLFAAVFVIPKLEQLWANLGAALPVGGTWVLMAAHFIRDDGWIALAAVIAVLATLEFRSAAWPRYRWGTLLCTAALINGAALAGLAMMSILLVLAAPAGMAR